MTRWNGDCTLALPSMRPLIALFGATASGKTALAIALAQRFQCRNSLVRLGLRLSPHGSGHRQTARLPNADLYLIICWIFTTPRTPAPPATMHGTPAWCLTQLAARNTLPILAGGTGLYARALLDGLFPAPPQNACPAHSSSHNAPPPEVPPISIERLPASTPKLPA